MPAAVPSTSLGKVMLVLDAFGAEEYEVGFATLGRRTRLSKGTLHRLLGDLVGARLLDRTASGYQLGGHLFELGMRASGARRLVEVATPYLEDLYERTHETVHLGVRQGAEVLYVAKIGGHRQAASPSRLGGRLPLHVTAIGKSLLAFAPDNVRDTVLRGPLEHRTPRTVVAPGALRRQLDRVRRGGAAYELEESQIGLGCVAAPVLGVDGLAVAAVSVTGPVTRFAPHRYGALVLAGGRGIASALRVRSEAEDVLTQGRR